MERVIEDGNMGEWKTDALSGNVQAVLPFLEKITLSPDEVGAEDVRKLREAGLSDEAIRDALYVCVDFNIIDRVADSLGFDLLTPEEFRKAARFLLKMGYEM